MMGSFFVRSVESHTLCRITAAADAAEADARVVIAKQEIKIYL
jgi:hypothetical protein